MYRLTVGRKQGRQLATGLNTLLVPQKAAPAPLKPHIVHPAVPSASVMGMLHQLTSQPVMSLGWLLLLRWCALVDAVKRLLVEGLYMPRAIKLGHEAVAACVGEADGARHIILPHIQLCGTQGQAEVTEHSTAQRRDGFR